MSLWGRLFLPCAFLLVFTAQPGVAQNALQQLFWHKQTSSCVEAVKDELGPRGKNLRYLLIEETSASAVERSVFDQMPAVRVSGILEIEGVFTLGDETVQCVMRDNEIRLRQREPGTLPGHCPGLLQRLENDVKWHHSLGFQPGEGRGSRASLRFACRFSDADAAKVHFFEPLQPAR